jgi:hypothetical protein
MEIEFFDRLSEPVRERRAKSVSEIIRAALERFNFEDVVVVRPAQIQISVRLSADARRRLKKASRSKHTSVGNLVRAAVESYLPVLEAAPPPAGPRKKKKAHRKGAPKRAGA